MALAGKHRRRLAIGAALVAVLLAANAIVTTVLARRLGPLRERVARSFGAAERWRAPVPANENAAPFYREAFAALPDGIARHHSGSYPRAILDRSAATLRLVTAGVGRERFRLTASTSTNHEMEHAAECVVRLLVTRARVERATDADHALATTAVASRFTRSLLDEPSLSVRAIDALEAEVVAEIETILAGSRPGASACLALARWLAPPPPERFFHDYAAVARKAFGRLAALRAGGTRRADGPLEHTAGCLPWLCDREEANALELVAPRAEALAHGVSWRTRLRLDDLEARSWVGPLFGYAPEAWRHVTEALTIAARRAVAKAALAARAYRERTGAYPDRLPLVVPDLIESVADPFTGELRVYRRAGRGIRISSVGRDRRDNGGGQRSDDLVLCLPD